ncbi:hypothetical protein LINGRAHAP2_LOCUS4192 [Linum grandiflorum]
MARLVRVNVMRRRRVRVVAVVAIYLKLMGMYLTLLLRLYHAIMMLILDFEPVYEPIFLDFERELRRVRFMAAATSDSNLSSLSCIRMNSRLFRRLCKELVDVGG